MIEVKILGGCIECASVFATEQRMNWSSLHDSILLDIGATPVAKMDKYENNH
jgi:hypothetical protein